MLRSLLSRSESASRFPSAFVTSQPRSACISFKPAADRCARVLHAARDPQRSKAVASLLETEQYELRSVHNPEDLFEVILAFAPDLVLVDDDFQNLNVGVLCSQLQVMAVVSQPRIVFLCVGDPEEDVTASALLAGADDYVSSDRGTELRARIRCTLRRSGQSLTLARVRRERNELQYLAFLDGLTGVPNRRSLDAVLQTHVRHGEGFAILFADIDHFKAINDRLGHAAGDAVLRTVAGALKECLRPGDFLCRFGGEEFVVIAPGITQDTVTELAERYRRRVAELTFENAADLRVTISLGADTVDPGEEGAERALANADTALYEAKRRGRNQTVVAGLSQ